MARDRPDHRGRKSERSAEPSVIGPVRRLHGRLSSAVREYVGRPLQRRTPLCALRIHHRLRRALEPEEYTDADPFSLRWVDPATIRRSILETAPDRPQWGRVEGGDWDRRWEPFDERPVPRAIVEHFEDGRPWRETPLYDHFADQLRRFNSAWDYTSMEAFDRRCAEIEALYRSIREHGYRSQRELAALEDAATARVSPFDEIAVDVGRDGELLWRSYGQHRLAIAKLLEVESVPVVVHRRHRRWQAVRDAVRRGADPSRDGARRNRRHPDLRPLVRGRGETP